MPVDPIPDDLPRVMPYLTVQGVGGLLEFIADVFDGRVLENMKSPDGKVMHAEVAVGDSVIMMGEARPDDGPMPAMLYIYVSDADSIYRRAIASGATSITEPGDQFYGDRNAGVKDSWGNQWWIASRIEKLSPEQLMKRAAELHGGS